jgi:NAD(P) transhydrogenase
MPLRPAALLRRLGRSSSHSQSRSYTPTTVVWEKAGSAKEEVKKTTPAGIPYDKLTVGIPKETFPLERRVAATPESVARLIKPGFAVQVESTAGELSFYADADYEGVGATIVDNVYQSSDIVLKVNTIHNMLCWCYSACSRLASMLFTFFSSL